jgi:hypothetical protein
MMKVVECAFGLLKKGFNILVIPDWSYSQRTLDLIMRVCTILHNMIIDDERDGGYDDNYHTITSVIAPPITYETLASLTTIFLKGGAFDFWIDIFEPSIRLDRACVEQVLLA